MIAEEYNMVLRNLTVLTDTKHVILARITGYDVSYISKWLGGIKLPSTRYIEQINTKLSQYFAERALEKKKVADICSLLSIPETYEDLSFEIYKSLNSSYRHSMKPRSSIDTTRPSSLKVITGNHDSLLFMRTIFQEKLGKVMGKKNILILSDFCLLADIEFWKCLQTPVPLTAQVTIHIGLDLKKLSTHSCYIRKLYRLLNTLLNYDFKFYDISNIAHANTIVMEREFVIQYALQEKNMIGICTYISDELLVQDIYNRFFVCFSCQQALLVPVRALGMQDIRFRIAFYSADHFLFFLTNGFDFLLPKQAVEDFLNDIHASKEISKQVKQLQIMWEELLSTGQVEFMMPMQSLLRYIETGNLFFADVEYKMKAAYRKIHVQHIIETMKKNSHITMGILQSTMETTDYQEFNLSFYSNYRAAFFKKNPCYMQCDSSSFYIVSSPQLVECFHHFFSQLKESTAYQLFSHTDICEKYEKYKRFVERTIALYENL